MGPFTSAGRWKLVADQGGASRLNGVVVGHGMDGPDHVVVDKISHHVDGAIGKAVRAGSSIPSGLRKPLL